jgi:hypothetical protein
VRFLAFYILKEPTNLGSRGVHVTKKNCPWLIVIQGLLCVQQVSVVRSFTVHASRSSTWLLLPMVWDKTSSLPHPAPWSHGSHLPRLLSLTLSPAALGRGGLPAAPSGGSESAETRRRIPRPAPPCRALLFDPSLSLNQLLLALTVWPVCGHRGTGADFYNFGESFHFISWFRYNMDLGAFII